MRQRRASERALCEDISGQFLATDDHTNCEMNADADHHVRGGLLLERRHRHVRLHVHEQHAQLVAFHARHCRVYLPFCLTHLTMSADCKGTARSRHADRDTDQLQNKNVTWR